jgi:hypothetical protein
MPKRDRMLICLDEPGTKSESSFSFIAICDVGGLRDVEAAARERNSCKSSLIANPSL